MELKMIAVLIKQRPALTAQNDNSPVTKQAKPEQEFVRVKEETVALKDEEQRPIVKQEPLTPKEESPAPTEEPIVLKVEDLEEKQAQQTPGPLALTAAVAPMMHVPGSPQESTGLPSPVSDTDTPQWAKAEEFGVEEQTVITDITRMYSHPWLPSIPSRPLPLVVARCTVELANQKRLLRQEEKQAIYNILNSFKSIPVFTNTIASSLRIKDLLLNILGESRSTKSYEYPEQLQRNASLLLDRLNIELEAGQQVEEQNKLPSPDASSDSDGNKTKKRKRGQSVSSARQPREALATISNPTYQHIMRGIIKTSQSYRLDPDRTHYRSSHVFGHNGLQVGQWWPLRICCLRDGAHGSSQGGIAWTSNQGATSIVVSGQYADLDLDRGDTLYYSGSNSHDNTEPENPQLSAATRSLRVSAVMRRPVRVIRSANGSNRYSPSQGLRYDGLYEIVGEETRKNAKGGAYLRFKFVRRGGQERIQEGRPDGRERQVARWIKEGYGW